MLQGASTGGFQACQLQWSLVTVAMTTLLDSAACYKPCQHCCSRAHRFISLGRALEGSLVGSRRRKKVPRLVGMRSQGGGLLNSSAMPLKKAICVAQTPQGACAAVQDCLMHCCCIQAHGLLPLSPQRLQRGRLCWATCRSLCSQACHDSRWAGH